MVSLFREDVKAAQWDRIVIKWKNQAKAGKNQVSKLRVSFCEIMTTLRTESAKGRGKNKRFFGGFVEGRLKHKKDF